MKIILLKDVAKVGKRHEIKDIADGHAQNFIIPRGFGIPATPGNVKKMETMKAGKEAERSVKDALLAGNLETLATTSLVIKGKANEKGNLFAGIHVDEIVKVIEKEAHLSIDPDMISLDRPLKEVGHFIVTINALGKKTNLKLEVQGIE